MDPLKDFIHIILRKYETKPKGTLFSVYFKHNKIELKRNVSGELALR